MKRAGWIAVAGLAAAAICVGALLVVLEARYCKLPPPIREPLAVEPADEKQDSPLSDATLPPPILRTAPDFHPAIAPTSIDVATDPVLEGSDLFDPDNRVFSELESPTKLNGPVAIRLGTTNGFSGTKVRVVLDPSTRTASVLVYDFVDAGPSETQWREVGGSVRLSNWKLDESTLIEVDLHGQLIDPEAGSKRLELRSIRACAQFPAGEPFVDIQVVVDPVLVLSERLEKNAYTQVDWKAHGTGLVTVWIGNGNGYVHSGAQVMLDTITHTARVRASNGTDVAGSTRFWKSLRGEVRLSSWDLDPAATKFSIDLQGELNGHEMKLQRVTLLRDMRFGKIEK